MADGGDDQRTSLLVVGVAIVVALGLGLGLRVLLGGQGSEGLRGPAGPTPEELALETAEAWLAAWEDDAHDDLAALAGDAPGVREAVVALRDDLQVAALEATVAGPAEVAVDGASASVPFETDVELDDVGTWRYQGRVELVPADPEAEDAGWLVAFRPAVLHPSLGDDGRFSLRTTWPERAGLTAADGTPLPAPGYPALNGQVVGATAPATPERAAELGDRYEVGRIVGVSGLQAAQEERLAGTPTVEVLVTPGDQIVAAFPGRDAETVATTIDLRLQAAAEAALAAGSGGKPAALVAVRPSTHEVVAVASVPTNGFNRAIAGRYPPGSTFKVVTATALLGNGVTADTPAPCPETIDIGGRAFRNAEGAALGDVVFRVAFTQSCNTAFVRLADELAPEQLVAAARAHGFDGDWTGFGMAAPPGSFPPPEGRIDQAASAIGQGRVLASPLQMAVVAANAAAGGYRPPRIVAGPPRPLEPLQVDVPLLQELMRLVVAEGTATRAQLPGEPVRGKTGTAEFGTERPPRTHAWFIGYRGDLAVAVVVEDGGFGGQVAAPLARDFLSRAG